MYKRKPRGRNEMIGNEVASLEKDRRTPSQHFLPKWRHILPAPPSICREHCMTITTAKTDPKNLQSASIMNGGQQINQMKNVLEFIKKTIETSSYEK